MRSALRARTSRSDGPGRRERRESARRGHAVGWPGQDQHRLSQPGGPLYNIEHSNGGLISFPGGVVLKDSSGKIVGAIGVSGGAVDQDHAVASAGAGAL